MRSRSIHRLAVIAAVGLLLASAPAWAATAQTENAQTNCGNCEALIDWNPTLSCDDPFADGFDLMECILGSGPPGCGSNSNVPTTTAGGQSNPNQPVIFQANPPAPDDDVCVVTHETGDYWVTRLPDPLVGLHIVRAEDESEIDRLHFTENYPELTWIEIEVDQPFLAAVIGEIEGTPTSGRIELTLNDRAVPVVQTVFHTDPREVSLALVAAIRQANFDVAYQRPYIVVLKDLDTGSGLTKIRFESTDSGIVKSEIALDLWERSGPEPELRVPPPR